MSRYCNAAARRLARTFRSKTSKLPIGRTARLLLASCAVMSKTRWVSSVRALHATSPAVPQSAELASRSCIAAIDVESLIEWMKSTPSHQREFKDCLGQGKLPLLIGKAFKHRSLWVVEDPAFCSASVRSSTLKTRCSPILIFWNAVQ